MRGFIYTKKTKSGDIVSMDFHSNDSYGNPNYLSNEQAVDMIKEINLLLSKEFGESSEITENEINHINYDNKTKVSCHFRRDALGSRKNSNNRISEVKIHEVPSILSDFLP